MEPTWKSNVYQFGFGVSASLSIAAAGAWLAWPSVVIPLVEKHNVPIPMTLSQIQTMVALMDLGNVLSPIPACYMMDLIGRKYTIMSAGFCAICASIFVMCAHTAGHIWMIYTGRLFAGMTKGIGFSVLPIYIAEIANTKVRGALGALGIAFLTLGSLFDYVNPLLIHDPNNGYQALNITNLIIPIIFVLSIFFFPESPYYLLMKGKEDEAISSLSKFRQIKTGPGLETEYEDITNKVENDMKKRARFIDLVTTSCNRRALLIISVLALFQRSSGVSPMIAYSTSTMPATGGGLSISFYMLLFSIVHTIATYGGGPIADNWGRKPLMIFSAFTSSITTAFIGVYYFLEKNSYPTDNIKWIPYAGLVIFAFTYGIGLGFIPSTVVGELFPTNIKSYASSISAIILAVVSFMINKIFKSVSEEYGAHCMFWSFSFTSLMCTIFVYFFMFETKGKTFSEIETYMESLERKKS